MINNKSTHNEINLKLHYGFRTIRGNECMNVLNKIRDKVRDQVRYEIIVSHDQKFIN